MLDTLPVSPLAPFQKQGSLLYLLDQLKSSVTRLCPIPNIFIGFLMAALFQLASSTPEEHQLLSRVIEDLSNHALKHEYAKWLIQQNDPRGEFLRKILHEWDAGEPFLSTDSSIDLVWQRTCGVTLMQSIRAEKFENVDAIFDAARPALMINPQLAESEIPIGGSKFGGLPDLAPGTKWPEFEGAILGFIGQINLADVGQTHLATRFPSTGLLSFFVFNAAETGTPAAGGEEGAWRVIYSPEITNFTRLAATGKFVSGNEVAPECVLEFEETLDLPYASTTDFDTKYEDRFVGCQRARELGLTNVSSEGYEELQAELMPDREERSHLLGWSHPQVSCDDPLNKELRNLITIGSEEVCQWCWADGHQLFFGITDENLRNKNFDKTKVVDG